MKSDKLVVNASPIISLAKIGCVDEINLRVQWSARPFFSETMGPGHKVVAGFLGLPFYQCTDNRVEYIIKMRSHV